MSSELQVNAQFGFADGFELDIALSAAGGTVTQLVGPSGSGKSTILSLIAGLLTPTTGEISLGDSVFFSSRRNVDIKPWRRNVGLLFQRDTLFPHLTVQRNLSFGAKKVATSPWQLEAICDAFQIQDLLHRKPSQLSGGQRDRVSLGRTLLSQPDVLLLDEPLNSVELDLRESIFEFVFQGAAEMGIPTLMVSHDSSLWSKIPGSVYRFGSDGLLKFSG